MVSTPDARLVLPGGHEHFAPSRTARQPRIWNDSETRETPGTVGTFPPFGQVRSRFTDPQLIENTPPKHSPSLPIISLVWRTMVS
jgi:hypothetical protein